ncbi:hypothetical protein [Halobacillus amylolyticus]|uniref:Uncharacterized protein n=1 Tax=Halobacillus amylolyticus TaxID=2932259 RepID=A0ABY4HGA1_9BACI|nr:hypothetical protein [Halobacillus amylolyticus]UOR13682.1 hypothetical protein MUO15_09700 [Halobacillus amylolyticus]
MDLVIFGVFAFGDGIIALLGFLAILGRRVTEPNEELQQKVEGYFFY